jgi:Spy/CpxP family protein refolding chaperone
MKTKILILVCFMSLSGVLMAQQAINGPRKEFRGQERNMRMEKGKMGGPLQGLNLTDAQKTAFKQGMLAMHKQIQPLQNELGEALAHQKTLMTTEKPDLAAIDKNIEKIGGIRIKMAKIKTRHHLDIRAQLNEEQQLKFDLFAEKMMGEGGPMGRNHHQGMGKGKMQNRPIPQGIPVQ